MSPPAPDPHERRAALALSLADGIGSATFRELVATFGYASRALQARSDANELLARAEALEQSAARASAALWVIGEAAFPAAFTALDRPPLWVTALGDPALLKFGQRERSQHDPDCVVGSSGALRGLGCRPRHNLTQTLASIADHWRAAASEPGVPRQ